MKKNILICALSLNIVLASALNAKSIEEIAAERVDIQNIYNIYNNELCTQTNTLMQALDNLCSNAKDCVGSIVSNLEKESALSVDIDKFERDLNAFKLSYSDISENYARQLKMLSLLEKVKEIDAGRVQFARNLLKNISLQDVADLKQVQDLEASLDRIESLYTSLYQDIATSSTSFSIVKPQILGVEASLKSLEKFFYQAKDNLKDSKSTLEEFEPKVDRLYRQYQSYLDETVLVYNKLSVLSDDILAKTLENFYEIKDNFAFTNGEDFVFDSYKNLGLRALSKPKDMLKIAFTSTSLMGLKGDSSLKKAKQNSEWAKAAGVPDMFSNKGRAVSATRGDVEQSIKELKKVNAIINDLKDNYNSSKAVLSNIVSLSDTIKIMSDKSVSMLKQALKLSTDSQVLLTNVEIFKGEFDIKLRQSNIAIDKIKETSGKIKGSQAKIKELL